MPVTVLGSIIGCGEGEQGERGERGERGRRGHRGHDGHDGLDGPTGPAGTIGATGPAGTAAHRLASVAGRFDPVAGGPVSITAQSGEFESSTYVGVGNYTLFLSVIPGITTANQGLWTGTVLMPIGGFILTTTPGFSAGGLALVVHVTDDAGIPVDQSFYIHGDLLGI